MANRNQPVYVFFLSPFDRLILAGVHSKMSQAEHGVAQQFGPALHPADNAESEQLDQEVK